jgi:hypothetical protein
MALPVSKIAKELFKTTVEQPKTLDEAVKATPRKRKSTKGKPAEQVIEERVKDISQEKTQNFLAAERLKTREAENPPIIDNTKPPEIDVELQNKINEKKRDLYLKSLTLKKEKEITQLVQKNKKSGVSAFDTAMDIISTKIGVGKEFSNIEGRTGAIYNRVSAGMTDLKDSLRTKVIGLKQDTELADDVVRYLKDGTVKNKDNLSTVTKISKQWSDSAEMIKSLRNKAGARIGKLEDWVIPQSHDKLKIIRAGKEAWLEYIKPRLDIPRIETEQNANIDDILENAYTNITARDAVIPKGKKQTAKQHEFERVLHFKTGEDIVSYKNSFGNPDVFGTMDSHLRQQSNEIAAMQIFGANPDANFEKLKELARADGMGSIAEGRLNTQWKVSTGQADGNDIVSTLDNVVAQIGGGHRAVQVASKLGSAAITSLADLSTIIVSSGYRGLSSVKIIGKGLDTLIQEITSGSSAARNSEIASRIGVISEFASASVANSRYAEVATGFMQRRAENVIRASGLGAWTNSLRVGFGLELAANMAENFTNKFKDVKYNKMLTEYGITSKEWDIIRSTEKKDIKGAKFLDLEAVYAKDEELGYRLSEMITQEMDSFVLTPTDRVRAYTTLGAKKGTATGELSRNVALFKSFPVTLTMMHINRFGTMNTTNKIAYSAAVITSNVILGSVALFAYDIATGKTARDPNRPAMIPEALAKGGGLGIFGDILLGEDKSRYGHSWASTVMGVPASTLEDIGKTLYEAASFDDKFIPNTYNRAKNYIPGQNLWYTRLLMGRAIGDAVGEIIDPDRQKKQRRRRKALRTRGQEELFR